MDARDRPGPRLLIVSKYFSYGFGGTPEAVLLLARSLDRAGVAVDVRAHDRFVPDAGRLADLPSGEEPFRHPQALRIADYAGVIVAGAWIFGALPIVLAARRAGLPVLYQTKGQLCRVEFSRPRDLRRLAYLFLIEIWIALLASNILFTSALERDATLLPRGLKQRKGVILPEPLDPVRLGRIERAPRAADAPLRLGFIAQISPRKGLREFVDGLLAWSASHPGEKIEFTVAGTAVGASEAYLAEIKSMIAARPCDATVRFVGQISGEARTRFYAETDVVVVPSRFESFCLAVPEALWFGCAVLAAPALGVLEFLRGHPAIKIMPSSSWKDTISALDGLKAFWAGACSTVEPHRPVVALAPEHVAAEILKRTVQRSGKA
jgi:glycosyltransferase involved in cell wall biosynthesis